ncbi:hypothetical protein [Thiococcus pfennigii]|uniref:hypothetical protein n=1 Tax=Thiococcus pfennigii TaxID=1057 RepID=UPI001F5B774D|nr:hypothetical protein [Thiococcus pfennigii]MBK1733521.1 hypothetical protein [Thiococcus pfennigii]
MFEECADLSLSEPASTLDIVAQQGFQNVERGGVAADLGDQPEQLAQPLGGLAAVDVPERELDQSG